VIITTYDLQGDFLETRVERFEDGVATLESCLMERIVPDAHRHRDRSAGPA
jgi:hypothetical protein